MPIFELGWAIPVKSHVRKFGLDQLKSEVREFSGGGGGGEQKPPIRGGGVTCDLRCPSSNLAEIFQSKAMCENLVRIGWAFQELSYPQTYNQKKKKKKKKSDATDNNILEKILFRRIIKQNHRSSSKQYLRNIHSVRIKKGQINTQEKPRRISSLRMHYPSTTVRIILC